MPLREDIYKILTELDRRRAAELDHQIQAETPGTPAYASGAIADIFPSPNSFLATTQEADLLAQYALPLGLGSLLAFPFLSEEQQTY